MTPKRRQRGEGSVFKRVRASGRTEWVGRVDDALQGEYVEAWIWTPKDGAYPLGPMRDGLGWVGEDNVCRGAANSDHIYFLRWKREADDE